MEDFRETSVKERIDSVLHYKKTTVFLRVCLMLLVIVVSVCFLTDGKRTEQTDSYHPVVKLVVGNGYAAYVDKDENLHILYDTANVCAGVDTEKKYRGLGADEESLVMIDASGNISTTYPDTAEEVERKNQKSMEEVALAGGNFGNSLPDPEVMRSMEALQNVYQISSLYPYHYIALLEDGTLVTEDGVVEEMQGLAQFAVDSSGALAGIKEDGTLLLPEQDILRRANFADWPQTLCGIYAGNGFVGLLEDGSVIAEETWLNYQINVTQGWSDIISLAVAGDTIVGLKADGTVVAVCKNGTDAGQCAVDTWTDIAAIGTNGTVTVGIKKDGSFVVTE